MRNYIKVQLTSNEVKEIVSNLAGNIDEIIRKNKEFDLGLFESKLRLCKFIYENQKLLQRPILFYKKNVTIFKTSKNNRLYGGFFYGHRSKYKRTLAKLYN